MTEGTRKIIQITAADERCHALLHALCDDGSLWRLARNNTDGKLRWHRLPGVPQPTTEEERT